LRRTYRVGLEYGATAAAAAARRQVEGGRDRDHTHAQGGPAGAGWHHERGALRGPGCAAGRRGCARPDALAPLRMHAWRGRPALVWRRGARGRRRRGPPPSAQRRAAWALQPGGVVYVCLEVHNQDTAFDYVSVSSDRAFLDPVRRCPRLFPRRLLCSVGYPSTGHTRRLRRRRAPCARITASRRASARAWHQAAPLSAPARPHGRHPVRAAERQARERGARVGDCGAERPPRRGHHRDQHGRPRHRHPARRQRRVHGAGARGAQVRVGLCTRARGSRARRPRGCRRASRAQAATDGTAARVVCLLVCGALGEPVDAGLWSASADEDATN